jgi:hypothetical protein
MRRRSVLLALTATALAASGCAASNRTSTPVATSPKIGVLTGTLGIEGGAKYTGAGTRCRCQAEPGTVRLTGSDGHRTDVTTDKSGKFSVRVPVGRYSIIAGLKRPYDWPMGSCAGLSGAYARFDQKTDSFFIVVAGGQSRHVVVICQAL